MMMIFFCFVLLCFHSRERVLIKFSYFFCSRWVVVVFFFVQFDATKFHRNSCCGVVLCNVCESIIFGKNKRKKHK